MPSRIKIFSKAAKYIRFMPFRLKKMEFPEKYIKCPIEKL